MILILDHYDSFVFNLVHEIEALGWQTQVRRHDAISLDEIESLQPSHLILSPGPSGPLETGLSLDAVLRFRGQIPVLGICLGHQVIGHVFGGSIGRAKRPLHGQTSLIWHDECGLFEGLSNPCPVGRYHSLIVNEEGLSPDFRVIARSEEGEIMAMISEKWKIMGLQFHPESILTVGGRKMLGYFLDGTWI